MSPDRDYRAEAMRILAGKGLMTLLPQKEHLLVVAQDAAKAEARAGQLMEILAVILTDTQQFTLTVPKELLEEVRLTKTVIAVAPRPDGGIALEVIVQKPIVENRSQQVS